MRKDFVRLAVVFSFITFSNSALQADPLTGTIDTGAGFGSQTTGTGPWTLTSSDSTYSYLGIVTNENPTFSQLTNVNAVFNSPTNNALQSQNPLNAGAGLGAPRIDIELAQGLVDNFLTIYLGDSPNYINTPSDLNAYSGVNLIGNNDTGRYDASGFAGGSPYTTYSSALAMLGSYTVESIYVVLDSFNGADKTLEVDSINGSFSPAPAPEPTTFASLGAIGLAFCGWSGLKWRKRGANAVA